MKKVSGTLKLAYSQFRELQSFAQFGSDLDEDTKARLEQGARIVEVLKQDRNSPVDVAMQVVIIYAVINNMLSDIPAKEIGRFEELLFDYMSVSCDELMQAIKADYTAEIIAEIEKVINICKEKYKA